MALGGSLKEFGLADILQLLYFQRKSGVLTIEGRADRVRLGFYEGNIVFAESRRSDYENRIGKILQRKGVLNEDGLHNALEEQKASGGKVGAILIKKGLVDKEAIEEVITSQITEIVVQLFGWKEGKYEFQPKAIPMDKDIPISLDTQHILMEGLRLLDEWSLVEGKVNLDSVFRQTGREAEDLSDDEREVLGYVDGKADVASIASVMGIDNFEASKIMLSLLEKEILTKAVMTEAKAPEVPARPLEVPLFNRLPEAVMIFSFVISVAILFIGGSVVYPKTGTVEELDMFRLKIEAYRYEHGSYPETPDFLKDAKDSWGNPYNYRKLDDGYSLSSSGPDGSRGTPDDII